MTQWHLYWSHGLARRPLLLLCAAALLCSPLAEAELNKTRRDLHNVPGEYGVVHFSGDVLVSPCILASESQEQLVVMKSASARQFHRAGDRSDKAIFVLKLQDCVAGAHQRHDDLPGQSIGDEREIYTTAEQVVSLHFTGEAEAENADLLRVEGNVRGLGLRLFDARGTPLSINQAQHPYLLSPGDNSLTFMAALEATQSQVSAGSYISTLHLQVEYL